MIRFRATLRPVGPARVLASVTALLLAGAVIAAAGPQAPPPPSPPPPALGPEAEDTPTPTVTARMAKDTFRQLEPIVVEVTIRNEADRAFSLPTDSDVYKQIGIELKGRWPVRHTRFYEREVLGKEPGQGEPIPLAPGASLRFEVVPNLIYDMTAIARYTLVFSIAIADHDPRTGATARRVARSRPLEIKVDGRPASYTPHD